MYRIRILLACQKGADLQGYAADQMASQELQRRLKSGLKNGLRYTISKHLILRIFLGVLPLGYNVVHPYAVGIYPVSGLRAGQFH